MPPLPLAGMLKISARASPTNRRSITALLSRGATIEDDMPRRELIDTGTDKRYVRRNTKGQFNESDDVGRSLAADRRQKAKKTAKPGQGDKGDRKRKAKAK